MEEGRIRFLIRGLVIGFMIGLIISGATAFPLPQETSWLISVLNIHEGAPGLAGWLLDVNWALQQTSREHPVLFYGTDWLAFAHIVIALLFIGPLRDPVRNVWVIEWGMIACVAVIPLAVICGPIRGIPFAWTLIDCSFGVVGIVPLIICRRLIRQLEQMTTAA